MNELSAWRRTGHRAVRVAHRHGWLAPRVMGPAWVLGVLLWVGLIGAGLQVYAAVQRDVPQTFPYADDHFRYGSIGSEAEGGVPYWIWVVLPHLFPEYLPDRPGE